MTSPSECCVYQIRNTRNGKLYIGSTTRRKFRWADHRRMLKQNRHHSGKLQAAWAKYGPDCFVFEVLEQCTKEQLAEREQVFIAQRDSYNRGYNEVPETRWTDPVRQAERTQKRWADPEQRARQSALLKKMWESEEYRARHAARTSEAQKRRWAKAGARLGQSERMKGNDYGTYRKGLGGLPRSDKP